MASISATGAWIAANAGTIAAVGSVAAAGTAAYATYESGVAASNLSRRKALAAGIDEKQKQIGMRENMLKALAAQSAGTLGSVGTGANTGFGANARRQITQEQNDLLVSKASSSAQVSILDQAASDSRTAGTVEAAGDIFRAAPVVAGGFK